jgi:hypothetical protein
MVTSEGFDDALLLDADAMDDHDAWEQAFNDGFASKLGGIPVSGARQSVDPRFPLLAQLVLDDAILPTGYGGSWFVHLAPASRRVSLFWH